MATLLLPNDQSIKIVLHTTPYSFAVFFTGPAQKSIAIIRTKVVLTYKRFKREYNSHQICIHHHHCSQIISPISLNPSGEGFAWFLIQKRLWTLPTNRRRWGIVLIYIGFQTRIIRMLTNSFVKVSQTRKCFYHFGRIALPPDNHSQCNCQDSQD